MNECMEFLKPQLGGFFVDATLGLGGHSQAMLEASDSTTVLGIDQDSDALAIARERLSRFGNRIMTFHSNFSGVRAAVTQAGTGKPVGILADLGVSSMQLDDATRGFSFRVDAPLDMRMDQQTGLTAADLLATLGRDELADIIYKYGEERASRKIARWIVENRERGEPVETTQQLADLVRRAVKKSKEKIHPATRTFQALRIAVNNELGVLDSFIDDSVDLLKTSGVLAIITFHSLEDRIVKRAFQRQAGVCSCPPRMPQCMCGAAKRVEILTRKPIVPTEAEQTESLQKTRPIIPLRVRS